MTSRAPLPTASSCLFLDVDGTLIEFAAHPSQAVAPRALKDLLMMLDEALEGAVALISGRPIAGLDAIFFPLQLRAAGVHGGERRELGGADAPSTPLDPRLDALRSAMRRCTARYPGVEFEDKRIAGAIHFRGAPGAHTALRRELAPLLAELGPEYHALEGNLVIEVKPRRFTKAHAIEEFLRQPPFLHRHPVFLGDDITDLDGFRVIDERHGLSIAVGDRVDAQWRLPDPAATRAWLGEFAASCAR